MGKMSVCFSLGSVHKTEAFGLTQTGFMRG